MDRNAEVIYCILIINNHIGLNSINMLVFDKKKVLISFISDSKAAEKRIGFVPTMGALHQGHLSLIEAAKRDNDVVVASIFVNPTQFNSAEDLKNYPRTFDSDKRMLEKAGTDVLFYPTVEEIYPTQDVNKETFDFGYLEKLMEGKHRPGHFNGVAQVVSKLFNIVSPDVAYFGEKDFQQLVVIRELLKKTNSSIQLISCPTVREKDGLAMSSRNMLLSEKERLAAPQILNALNFIKKYRTQFSVAEIRIKAIEIIEQSGNMKVEYLELADAVTLQPVTEWNSSSPIRCFTAVQLGRVRLIDNIALNDQNL